MQRTGKRNKSSEKVGIPNSIEPRNTRNLSIDQNRTELYQGPLPPPDMLAEYHRISPKAVEIILEQFQKQGEMRRELERLSANTNSRLKLLGLVITALFGFSFVLLGFYLIYKGNTIEGLAALIIPLIQVLHSIYKS